MFLFPEATGLPRFVLAVVAHATLLTSFLSFTPLFKLVSP